MPQIAYLECSRCKARVSAATPQTVHGGCPQQPPGSFYVRYDLSGLVGSDPDEVIARTAGTPWRGMWRYSAVLPEVEPVTLGEGWTPMLHSKRYKGVYLKEEGANPTGTFKARGLALAVSMARSYGLKKLAVPSAGNAAGALAAYAAAAGIEAHIFMPRDVPFANYVEAVAYGAKVTLVDGLISDCARIVAENKESEGWFDVSTLKEPFRVEGKKTMGYELVEQLGWVAPGRRPKMIAVQAAGCAPVTRAYDQGADASTMWQDAATFAAGLRVPKPYGDYILLDIVRESKGTTLAVSDEAMLASILDWARHEGIFLSPEGAAVTAAYDVLLGNGFLKPSDRVVLFNTGAGLKYTDVTAEAMKLVRPTA